MARRKTAANLDSLSQIAIPSDLLTVTEAANFARVHIKTIRRWIHRRQITYYGHPKAIRISAADLIPRVPALSEPRQKERSWMNSRDMVERQIESRRVKAAAKKADAS